MNLQELKKRARRDAGYRKAEWLSQWDKWHQTALIVSELRFIAKMTQKDFAKKVGTKQSVISRAEDEGCSLYLLNRMAKAANMRVVLKLEKANKLK